MKKLISIIAVFAIILMTLAGCGSTKSDKEEEAEEEKESSNSIAIGTGYKAGDIEFSLYKVVTTDKLEAVGGSGVYYNADEGNVYVDIIIDLTNNGEEEFTPDEDITGYFKSNKNAEYEDMSVGYESDGSVNLYSTISPLATERVHIAYEIPEDVTLGKAHFTIDKKDFTFDYDASVKVSSEVAIEMNQEVKIDDKGSFKITSVTFTDTIYPSDTSGYYRYYPIDDPDTETYFVVYFDISNLSSTAFDPDDIMTIKAVFDGKYEYTGNLVFEEKDGTGFDSYIDISPLESRLGVYKFEVPKQVQDMDYELSIYFMGTEYCLSK